jgi:hypothetical protein
MTAFWPGRRFSTWSETADWGPSLTSPVASTHRSGGNGCSYIEMASSLAVRKPGTVGDPVVVLLDQPRLLRLVGRRHQRARGWRRRRRGWKRCLIPPVAVAVAMPSLYRPRISPISLAVSPWAIWVARLSMNWSAADAVPLQGEGDLDQRVDLLLGPFLEVDDVAAAQVSLHRFLLFDGAEDQRQQGHAHDHAVERLEPVAGMTGGIDVGG